MKLKPFLIAYGVAGLQGMLFLWLSKLIVRGLIFEYTVIRSAFVRGFEESEASFRKASASFC